MPNDSLHYWEVWYPKAAATGLLVARGLLDSTDRLLFHAAPDVVTAYVYDLERNLIARGSDLERTLSSPMCLLTVTDSQVAREDLWPDESHYGLPVLLPGGETGILQSWWNAEDRQEWRWQIEFYNSTR